MKNSKITKNRMPMALLLLVAASIVALAPGFSTSVSADSRGFSINDVSGNYVDHGQRWSFGAGGFNDKQSVPSSVVGLFTFTPATGTFHWHIIVIDLDPNGPGFGVIDRDGTYTVDPDGHGTTTTVSLTGNIKRRDFYIVNGGAELKWITTDPPGTAIIDGIGTLTKQ